MIGLLIIAAAQAAASPMRYQLCEAQGQTVSELRNAVLRSRQFKDVSNSGEWHGRRNERDVVWLFPAAQGGADIAICRQIFTDERGTVMETRLICDGPDAACEAGRDRLLDPGAAAIPRQ
ncbi:hypothetical protein [Sphingomonas sp.]|uniref:hypothetical protein n=1 Tax=Sphingomonas sp. TaxID=28214 RepID=UPI003CC57C8F